MSVLAFEGVGVRLGTRAVLDGVDLTLEPGEMLGLIGRNGAGKTTLLRVATRVLAPDAGRVLLADRPLADFSRPDLARRLAIVPQDTHVPFPFSVLEVVLMGRSPHLRALAFESRDDFARAEAALRKVGIPELAERSILELSGGERQLVLVARALCQDPEVLLFDEPTAFLDLRHRVEVLALVRERVRSGASALVVSHDLGLAARFCDRLALLAGGRVLAAGPPADVLTPENLRDGFGIEADVMIAPDGPPVVVPRAPTEPGC